MSLSKYEALDILYRNKVIYQMCIEDIDLCKDMRVRPAFVRFPESFDWSINGFINEKGEYLGCGLFEPLINLR
jgi:hypothetical protein